MSGTMNKGTLDKGSLIKVGSGNGGSPTPPSPTEKGEFFVKVIDYDGTVIDEQWLDDGAEYTLPANPDRTDKGLVFQEWSCSQDIVNGKVTIDKHNVIVGAIYTTVSGQNEFDIELTTPTGLTVTLNIDGDKDWGDGTTDNLTSHTYSQIGKYTIKTDGTTITSSSSSGLFGQSSSAFNDCCISIRLATVQSISDYSFQYLRNLQFVSMSNAVTNIGQYAFQNSSQFKAISFPSGLLTIGYYGFRSCYIENVCFSNKLTTLGSNSFDGCKLLKFVIIPKSISTVTSYAFANCSSLDLVDLLEGVTSTGNSAFSACALTKVILPSTFSSFGQYSFQYNYYLKKIKTNINTASFSGNSFGLCYSLVEYDFTSITSVSVLYNTNAFNGINKLCKIKVLASLENAWKTTTGWSNYADYIVGV